VAKLVAAGIQIVNAGFDRDRDGCEESSARLPAIDVMHEQPT
jgi:hypothetical protein